MPIDPIVLSSPGTPQGLAQKLQDLDRRIRNLASVRTSLGVNTVGNAEVRPGSISTSSITAGSITVSLLAAGAVTAYAIAAGTITANEIATRSISADRMIAGSITTAEIAANTILAANIAAGAITGTEIAAGTITSNKLNVTTLSSITSNMGALTAGTITGATLQSAGSGSRVVMDSAGLRGYALDGVTKTFEINTGSGVASFTGIANIQSGSVVPTSAFSGIIPATNFPVLGGGNRVKNSNFGDPVTPLNGWGLYSNGAVSGSTLTFDSTVSKYGAGSGKLTAGTSEVDIGVVRLPVNTAGIPVAPNTAYTASAWVRAASTGRACFVLIHWYDAAFTLVPGSAGTSTVDSTAWSRRTVTLTSPSNAAYAVIYVIYTTPPSGEVHYVDGIQLEEGAVATAYAPKPDEILPNTITGPELAAGSVTTVKMTANSINGDRIQTNTLNADRIVSNSIDTLQLKAGAVTTNVLAAGAVTAQKISVAFGGQNILNNASFEDTFDPGGGGVVGWLNYGGTFTRDVGSSAHGSARLLVTNGTGAALDIGPRVGVPVLGDKPYVLSAFLLPGTASTTLNYQLYIDWYTGTPASFISASFLTINPLLAGWNRYVLPTTAPANATSATVYVIARNVPAGQTFYVDAVQFEQAEVAAAFAPKPGEILTGSVGNTQIAPDSVTTDKILAGTILASDIRAATITGNEISALSITTAHLVGTAIDGMTITGPTIQTSAANPKMRLTAAGLQALNASGAVVSTFAADGTGTFTGPVNAVGVTISAPGTPPFAPGNIVRWVRSVGGTQAGRIIVQDLGTTSSRMYLDCDQQSIGGGYAALTVETITAPGQNSGQVHASAGLGSSGGTRYSIVDAVGNSDFLLRTNTASFRVVGGTGRDPWAVNNFSFSAGGTAQPVGGSPSPPFRNIFWGMTGYSGTIGLANLDLYINGAFWSRISFYFNQTYVHMYCGTNSFSINLAAGVTHTWQVVQSGVNFSFDLYDTFWMHAIG